MTKRQLYQLFPYVLRRHARALELGRDDDDMQRSIEVEDGTLAEHWNAVQSLPYDNGKVNMCGSL